MAGSGSDALGSFQGTISGSGYGFVYLMSYPGSDKVKIGHSHDPLIRATQIGGTLAPDEPVVEAYFWCSERREEVERRAHKIVTAHRHRGEWFSLSVEQAYEAITTAARDTGVALQLVFDRADHERAAILDRERKERERKAEEARSELAAILDRKRKERERKVEEARSELVATARQLATRLPAGRRERAIGDVTAATSGIKRRVNALQAEVERFEREQKWHLRWAVLTLIVLFIVLVVAGGVLSVGTP